MFNDVEVIFFRICCSMILPAVIIMVVTLHSVLYILYELQIVSW